MALTLSTGSKNASVDARVDRLDGGSPGKLVILTAADAVLATFTLSNPAFGAASAGSAAAASLPKQTTATGTGTAAKYEARRSDDTVEWSGTVGTSGADCIIDNISITSGQTVNLTAWTHAQP